MKRLELLIPPVIQVLIWAALISVTNRHLSTGESIPYFRVVIAGISIGGGLLISLLGVLEFRKKKTTVDPRYPERVNELVQSGVYRFSRNPMYLGFFLGLLGMVIYYGHAISLTFVLFYWVYMTRLQILPEEKVLERIYGDSYKSYKKRVGRWFII